jgi:DNA-binding MarR family transcriptional regulator
MSEVLKYNKVTLGLAEKYFLNEIMGGPKSAYTIWDIRRKRGRPMNYKNVHTRIKKLEKLNLIEKMPGKFLRGAIKYRLTTQGLFYQVSKRPEHELELLSLKELMDSFGDNIIFRTLLLPYFEIKTLTHAGILTYVTIFAYLGECYRVTIYACERIKEAINENDSKYRKQHVKKLKEDLQWWPKEFAFRLITKTPDRASQLAKDNKFMKLLKEVQLDFEKGLSAVDNIRSTS